MIAAHVRSTLSPAADSRPSRSTYIATHSPTMQQPQRYGRIMLSRTVAGGIRPSLYLAQGRSSIQHAPASSSCPWRVDPRVRLASVSAWHFALLELADMRILHAVPCVHCGSRRINPLDLCWTYRRLRNNLCPNLSRV